MRKANIKKSKIDQLEAEVQDHYELMMQIFDRSMTIYGDLDKIARSMRDLIKANVTIPAEIEAAYKQVGAELDQVRAEHQRVKEQWIRKQNELDNFRSGNRKPSVPLDKKLLQFSYFQFN